MKKYLIIFVFVMMFFSLAACGNEQLSGENQPGNQNHAPQNEMGSGTPDNAPVEDADNPKFDSYLKPFPALLKGEQVELASAELTAEQLFEWIKNVEDTYQKGMFAQFSFSQAQRDKIEKWLSKNYSEELVLERLNKAMQPVEGGYRITRIYNVYDFNISHIEEVVNLDMQKDGDGVTLTADLIVKENQPIKVSYQVTGRNGTTKITGYQFQMIEKSE